jgi:Mrp family chromosome partitioning ATPase
MGLFGVAQPISIYPGQIGTMFGAAPMPTGPTGLQATQFDTVIAGAQSRPVVIAAVSGGFSTSQNQVIWRVFATGAVNVSLLASVDGNDADYVVIDNWTGTGNSGPRIIQADYDATPGPAPIVTAKIVSAARFFICQNSGGLTVALYSDITVS